MSTVQTFSADQPALFDAADVVDPRVTHRVRTEIADPVQFERLQDAWADLLARADTPNVFMSPAFLRAAHESAAGRNHGVILTWRTTGGRQQLVGAWAFSVGPLRESLLPVRATAAPPYEHSYLGSPVIDRDCLDETLDAMLDAIADAPRLPHVVAFDDIAVDTATYAALERVLKRRGTAPCVLEEFNRPKLQSTLDGKAYLEKAISSSSRKKLRQHRRRLSEKGTLTTTLATTPDDVRRSFEDFLTIEAAGWKGRQSTALLCDEKQAAFARGAVAALAERGRASVHALTLDGKPISLQVVLRAGAVAFTWKTTYDEAFRDFSPGMLLLEDYTAAFLADKTIAHVDSCALDDTSYMSAWAERQRVADVWIDAMRGGSFQFRALSRLQRTYRDMRAAAKSAYLSLRKSRAR